MNSVLRLVALLILAGFVCGCGSNKDVIPTGRLDKSSDPVKTEPKGNAPATEKL
jgi:hypothetical protein